MKKGRKVIGLILAVLLIMNCLNIRAIGENDFSDLSQSTAQKIPYSEINHDIATIAAHRDAVTAVLILGGNLTTI